MTPLQLMSGEEAAQARKRLGLSQSQLARLLGYDKRHSVANVETGARHYRAPQQLLLNAYLAGYRPADWPL